MLFIAMLLRITLLSIALLRGLTLLRVKDDAPAIVPGIAVPGSLRSQ